MSTVVDNDKYIINGSTLSDIGDALRNTVGGKTLLETQYAYYITDSGQGTSRITFNDSYFGITGVQKIKFIPTSITGGNGNGGTIYSGGKSYSYYTNSVNKESIYTLPAYWQGQSWTNWGSTYSSACTFKVYPLDENENALTPSQQIITSKNYQSDPIKTEKTFSSSENFLVSQISPLIETINQNNLKIGFAWPFTMLNYNNSSNANSYNMKNNFNIVDLKQIELLFFHDYDSSQWFLLEPSNTITHEYPTGISSNNYSSNGKPVTTYEGYKYSPGSTTYSGVSTWRTSLTKTAIEVFLDPATKRILNTYNDFRAYQHPAIIVYK